MATATEIHQLVEVGKTYEIRHSRKGTFTGRVIQADPDSEWVTLVVTGGIANAVMSYNVAYEGDEVTVRRCHSHFIPRD